MEVLEAIGMILVKKLNQQEILVNCELIQTIEFSPHAVISLTSGEKIVAAEGPDEIIRKVIEYKRAIGSRPLVIRTERPKREAV
jgi:flagellar protein FlbD